MLKVPEDSYALNPAVSARNSEIGYIESGQVMLKGKTNEEVIENVSINWKFKTR